MINDILYTRDGKLMIPEAKRIDIIKTHHESVVAAHPGVSATIAELKRNYFWPNLQLDVEKFIAGCEVCLRRKTTNVSNQGLLNSITSNEPFELIALDFVGERARTKRGNSHILMSIDIYSLDI